MTFLPPSLPTAPLALRLTLVLALAAAAAVADLTLLGRASPLLALWADGAAVSLLPLWGLMWVNGGGGERPRRRPGHRAVGAAWPALILALATLLAWVAAGQPLEQALATRGVMLVWGIWLGAVASLASRLGKASAALLVTVAVVIITAALPVLMTPLIQAWPQSAGLIALAVRPSLLVALFQAGGVPVLHQWPMYILSPLGELEFAYPSPFHAVGLMAILAAGALARRERGP